VKPRGDRVSAPSRRELITPRIGGGIVSPAARNDLIEIAEHIAADNINAALRMRDRFFAAFARPAGGPG
jgi:hypothetical protein